MDRQKRIIVRLGLGALLIVSLTVLLITLFGDPSPQAQNARTLSQLQQYLTALELVRLEKGSYPLAQEPVCLGDYIDDRCWDKGGQGVFEDAQFNDMLDTYVPILPAGQMIQDSRNPEHGREGYIYQSRMNGRGFQIQYVLVGKEMSCGFGEELSVEVQTLREQTNTFCTLTR